MSAPDPDLIAGLAAECTAWQALADLLRLEEAALVAGDAEAVAGLTPEKLTLLQTLANLARMRGEQLERLGFSADATGMGNWLDQHAHTESARLWQRLALLERETRAANLRVGALIDLNLATTRQSLGVLLEAAGKASALYDPSGQSVAPRPGGMLGAA